MFDRLLELEVNENFRSSYSRAPSHLVEMSKVLKGEAQWSQRTGQRLEGNVEKKLLDLQSHVNVLMMNLKRSNKITGYEHTMHEAICERAQMQQGWTEPAPETQDFKFGDLDAKFFL